MSHSRATTQHHAPTLPPSLVSNTVGTERMKRHRKDVLPQGSAAWEPDEDGKEKLAGEVGSKRSSAILNLLHASPARGIAEQATPPLATPSPAPLILRPCLSHSAASAAAALIAAASHSTALTAAVSHSTALTIAASPDARSPSHARPPPPAAAPRRPAQPAGGRP